MSKIRSSLDETLGLFLMNSCYKRYVKIQLVRILRIVRNLLTVKTKLKLKEMNLCWFQGISQKEKKSKVVNEEGAVPKCRPGNFVDSLEKSSEKDLCEVSEEKVLDFPLPNLMRESWMD